MISPENIKLAICKASKGKRKRPRVKQIYNNQDRYIEHFQTMAENYHHRKKPPRKIYDGVCRKQREIVVPSFDEQVLHHMIVNVLEPIIRKGMYEHVHGSIPGRGPAKSKAHLERCIRNHAKSCKYFLKMDIRHFFGSIDHGLLEAFIAKRIHDPKMMRVIHEVISCTDVGLPLGFHTSHWLANWYLQDLDHYIKEDLGADIHVRYMDDMVILGSNKKKLHEIRKNVESYLAGNKNLTMENKWQVRRFEYKRKGKTYGSDIDFMGYRFHRGYTTLRRSIMLRMSRRARRISRKEKTTIFDCRQMLSALGWIKATDTYRWYEEWIKPYVSFRKCRKRVSSYDRRINRQ
ncbi:MAG: hypothetical protein ILP16_09785 [Spirochaetales bacterium]|nr:hypothetical protein [Spirochaetales bacterium]